MKAGFFNQDKPNAHFEEVKRFEQEREHKKVILSGHEIAFAAWFRNSDGIPSDVRGTLFTDFMNSLQN